MPFLLWKVNKLIVSRQMLDEMYHASLNLSLRLIHEMDSEKEVRLTLKDRLKLLKNDLDVWWVKMILMQNKFKLFFSLCVYMAVVVTANG